MGRVEGRDRLRLTPQGSAPSTTARQPYPPAPEISRPQADPTERHGMSVQHGADAADPSGSIEVRRVVGDIHGPVTATQPPDESGQWAAAAGSQRQRSHGACLNSVLFGRPIASSRQLSTPHARPTTRPMGHQGPGRKTTAAWGACAAVSRPLSGPAAAAARIRRKLRRIPGHRRGCHVGAVSPAALLVTAQQPGQRCRLTRRSVKRLGL